MMRDKILSILRDNMGEFVSGEALGKKFDISRTAVWKHISGLREQGYVVQAYQNVGYRLDSIPDLLLPAEVKYNLKTTFIGKEIHYFDSTDSTNDVAVDLANEGFEEGTMAIAEEQTQGKGRMGRVWHSPYALGVYLSLVLRPIRVPPVYSTIFTMLSALAVADTVESLLKITPVIKWPNDVMIDGKKISGVLVQMKADPDTIDYLVVGIGVNLNQSKKDFPGKVGLSATSLKASSGEKVDRMKFLCSLLETFENYYLKVRDKNDYQSVKDRWLSLSGILGKKVVIKSLEGKFEGRVVEVGLGGNLGIKVKNGSIKEVYSGDIVSIRN